MYQNIWGLFLVLDFNGGTNWQRISIQEILEDAWFKKNYKRPVFEEKEEANLDDVEAVFKDSEVSESYLWVSCFLFRYFE